MHRPHRSPYPSGPILSPPPSAVSESCTDFSSALSPLLTYLLSLVYRDGFTGHTGLGLLRELYPYLQADRQPPQRNILQRHFGPYRSQSQEYQYTAKTRSTKIRTHRWFLSCWVIPLPSNRRNYRMHICQER